MRGSGQKGFYSNRETCWLEIKMSLIIVLKLSIQRKKIQKKFGGILAEQNLSKTRVSVVSHYLPTAKMKLDKYIPNIQAPTCSAFSQIQKRVIGF